MEDTPILDQPWPPELNPADVPFRKRSVTILRRMGYFDDPALFNFLTETDVLRWWNIGVGTVADIRDTGNAAIRLHHEQAAQIPRLRKAMAVLAEEPWASHVWRRDPRFAEYLPKGDSTVHDIAISGSLDDQRALHNNLEALRDAVEAQATKSLPEAVAEYVEAISGQHGERLDVLLACTGLNGQDPITGAEAARLLGVSHQRVSQLVGRLHQRRDLCRPPEGVWMPQIDEAGWDGWPDGYTGTGMAATRGFFGVP